MNIEKELRKIWTNALEKKELVESAYARGRADERRRIEGECEHRIPTNSDTCMDCGFQITLYRSCRVCKEIKKLSDYPKEKNHYYNKSHRCRECAKVQAKKSYQNNKEKRKVNFQNYQQVRKVKHAEKMEARGIMSRAIRSGKLIRLPCEVCGSPKSEGHHPDYSKPLEVMWLCITHHREWHRNNSLINKE